MHAVGFAVLCDLLVGRSGGMQSRYFAEALRPPSPANRKFRIEPL